jgi:hypothetical protein
VHFNEKVHFRSVLKRGSLQLDFAENDLMPPLPYKIKPNLPPLYYNE